MSAVEFRPHVWREVWEAGSTTEICVEMRAIQSRKFAGYRWSVGVQVVKHRLALRIVGNSISMTESEVRGNALALPSTAPKVKRRVERDVDIFREVGLRAWFPTLNQPIFSYSYQATQE